MNDLRINIDRLIKRIQALATAGALPGGGTCRLALSDADRVGRDRVCQWMHDLGMTVTVDRIGNVVAVREGRLAGPPVMMGSHIDTVATGGLYDGNLGVLAALEVIEVLNESQTPTDHPLAVAFFTNEEGVRFQPDMLGSSVYAGSLSLEEGLAARNEEGVSLDEELRRIGYAGAAEPGHLQPKAYVELHIEQGPILDKLGLTTGCVTGVQGISWQELTLTGVSNHAGTTPMSMRRDAGYAAAAVAVGVRRFVREMGGDQVGTCAHVAFEPNLINVIARKAILTVDLRHTDEARLQEAEQRLEDLIARIAAEEEVTITRRLLARFAPVVFDERIVSLVEATAQALGYSHQRMYSGAGHDAGLMAGLCPTGMIFTPSVDGLSHNVGEFTRPEDLEAGANVLLHTVLNLASSS